MNSFCSYFNSNQCKSCTSIEEDYASQLTNKNGFLKKALSFFPELNLANPYPSSIQGFRNRAKMVVTGTVNDPIIGLTGEDDLDIGRELLNCPIHHPKLNELIQAIPDYIREFNLIPYQIKTQKGELKGLILYYSEASQELYLRFVLRSKECVSRLQKMLPRLQTQFPKLVCISANLQPVPHAILEGREEIFLTARHSIFYQLGELKLTLSPQAFVQTNEKVALGLYQTAAEWIASLKPPRMLELYSGQGAFSFFAAKAPSEILGIEINPDAVRTANETASKLGLGSLRFECADATKVNQIAQDYAPDLILVNPPRRGLGEGVRIIESILPENLIYSSCSVESLAKDLSVLAPHYEIKKTQIFDMFPHTEHFETLIWLAKKRDQD
jgi:23S rRNA (uracil747-C5)-methyltransferase